jgi:prepilin peptidase CpaA
VVFPFAMAFAAISDLLSMTIANRVSIILMGSFLVLAPMLGMGWYDYGMHAAAGGAVLAVTFALFTFGSMGGGDAKLMASTALWFGFNDVLLQYLAASAILGGMLTLAILAYRKSPLPVFVGNVAFLKRMANDKEGVPYGIALGLGGLITFPESEIVSLALSRLLGN